VQPRLLLPVLPLLFLVLLEVLDRPADARCRQIFWPAVFLLLSLSLLHNGYRAARPMHSTPNAAGKVIADPGLGAGWIRDNTGPGDLVMVRWPLRQHIHFLRPVVGFGTIDRMELEHRIKRFGVDYIFLGPGETDTTTSNLFAVLNGDPGRFEQVHQDAGTGVMIYKVALVP
jgi:hypothetical protein